MGRSSDSRSSAPVLPLKLSFARPISSSSNRFSSPMSDPLSSSPASSSSSFASSSTSSSSSAVSAAANLFQRSSSPTRVNLRHSSSPPAQSVRISLDRPLSPSPSVSVRDQVLPRRKEIPKRTCMCSPTTHPGSFRCNYHRNLSNHSNSQSIACSPSRLNLRRSAMTNSLVRIGTVEGDWVKRALSALIRPSSHQQRRRTDFQPRPSRFLVMSKAEEGTSSEVK